MSILTSDKARRIFILQGVVSALLLTFVSNLEARTAYVTNAAENSITIFTVDDATGDLTSPSTTVSIMEGPLSLALSPDGRNLYVVNSGSENVTTYDISDTGDPVSPSSTMADVGSAPQGIAVHPTGKYVYVVNQGLNEIVRYKVNQDRDLSEPVAVTAEPDQAPRGVAVSAGGGKLFVTNQGAIAGGGVADGTFTTYEIGEDGTLTREASIATGADPFAISVTPGGSFLYVADQFNQTISVFDFDEEGLPVPQNPPAGLPSNAFPGGISISPNSSFLHVTAPGLNAVVAYSISDSGILDLAGPALLDAVAPRGIYANPNGEYVYVTSSGDGEVKTYSVDPASGALGSQSTVTSGTGPGSVPSGIVLTADQGPKADLGVTYQSGSLTAIIFDGTGSTAGDGADRIDRYNWDFGDGETLTDGPALVVHTYAAPGSYTASLTVTDDQGNSTTTLHSGQTAYYNGNLARSVKTVEITEPDVSEPASPLPAPAPASVIPFVTQEIPIPTLTLVGKNKAQTVSRRGVAIKVKTDLPADVTIKGSVVVPGQKGKKKSKKKSKSTKSKRSTSTKIRFETIKGTLDANQTTKFRLRFASGKDYRRLKKLLNKGLKRSVKIKVSATNSTDAGTAVASVSSDNARRTVRLRRSKKR